MAPAKVRIAQAPEDGQHVRHAGEDVAEGDLLVAAGTALGPRHLGLLASVGRAIVRVRPRPRVVIISTGTELRQPGAALDGRPIYDGNSFLLAAAAAGPGAVPFRVGLVADQPEALPRRARRPAAAPTPSSPPAASRMGDYDVVKAALSPVGPCGSARWRCSRASRRASERAATASRLRAARQPGLLLPLLRDVRAARAAP